MPALDEQALNRDARHIRLAGAIEKIVDHDQIISAVGADDFRHPLLEEFLGGLAARARDRQAQPALRKLKLAAGKHQLAVPIAHLLRAAAALAIRPSARPSCAKRARRSEFFPDKNATSRPAAKTRKSKSVAGMPVSALAAAKSAMKPPMARAAQARVARKRSVMRTRWEPNGSARKARPRSIGVTRRIPMASRSGSISRSTSSSKASCRTRRALYFNIPERFSGRSSTRGNAAVSINTGASGTPSFKAASSSSVTLSWRSPSRRERSEL